MAMRRRRRPRVVWLPVHGRDFSEDPEVSWSGAGIGGVLAVPQDGTFVTEVQPVTFDYSDSASQEEGTDFRSLQDLTSGNAYRLRRIVGKIFGAAVPGSTANTSAPLLDVACGFMVNRTDSSGNIADTASFSGLSDVTSGPLAQDAMEDPWIWRRRWLLSGTPPGYTSTTAADIIDYAAGHGFWPPTTAHYGSVQDGGHIDQKTARVISHQERLYFWVQVRDVNQQPTGHAGVFNYALDVRLLASLRMNVGNRRNASR